MSELARKALAELIGTAFLLAAVVGSGIAAVRLSPGEPGLQLLANSLVTGAALVAIILAIGPISGAHLNPVVTLADRVLGGVTNAEAGAYVAAQLVGGALGAVLANLMFDLPAITFSGHERSASGLWLGEIMATFGLLLVILGIARSKRVTAAPFAVGAYIAAAYWFTSSTSFANPAVTVARTLSDTFAGIAPTSVPAFVVAQIAGAALALGAVRLLHPDVTRVADRLVVPHEPASPASHPTPARSLR